MPFCLLFRPRSSDTGAYGCQISTTPHKTRVIHLVVHGEEKFLVVHILTKKGR